MRRVSQGTLLEMLRSELRRPKTLTLGVADLDSLRQTLQRTQRQLYDEHDWSFKTQAFPREAFNAGQRYYDPPANVDLYGIDRIVCWYNDISHDLIRGVGPEEYDVYSSDDDERIDPVLRWEIRATSTTEQIEFWPIPASDDGQEWQIFGRRDIVPMVDDDDLCDLDADLIVLFAAAELSTGKDKEAKSSAASRRLATLKAQSSVQVAPFTLGGFRAKQTSHPKVTVRVRG